MRLGSGFHPSVTKRSSLPLVFGCKWLKRWTLFKKQLELFIAAVFSAHGVGIFPINIYPEDDNSNHHVSLTGHIKIVYSNILLMNNSNYPF